MKRRLLALSTISLILLAAPTTVSADEDEGRGGDRTEQAERGPRGDRGKRGDGGFRGRGRDGDRGGRRGGEGSEGGGRGGRWGGRGGFGGGPGGPDVSLVGLLGVDEVRQELDLSDEQLGALTRLRESMRPERSDANPREMTEQERRDWFREMQTKRQEMTAKVDDQMQDILLPGQIERLQQISLQQRGAAALMDPKVREAINMTEAQIKELKEKGEKIREEMVAKMRENFQGGNFEGAREKMEELRESTKEKMMSVLTDEQRSQLNSMQGERFDMPRPERRGMNFGGDRGDRGGFGGNRGGGRPRGGDRQRPDAE